MEPLILYLVLFFPGYYSLGPETVDITISFSIFRELSRFFGYSLSGLALIWYLIFGKKSLILNLSDIKPGKRDVFSFLWAFPGLVLIGAGISFIAAQFSSFSIPVIEAPGNASGWIVLALSCLGTGYLEESFFRFYLLKKLKDQVPYLLPRILFSTLLFALCHMYEGFYGILNAVCAGLLLAFIFEKNKSLHGLAWAHALYNAFVYVA